ncbi:MAG TPA: biopolymer transporter ExbD [Oceanipulchritudo sp.]|nr:biopolymer transporter ExbD [Oceanipulchritudo sp.]
MNVFLGSEAGAEEPAPDPGLTPLVDVVFQLLIFFILTSTFATPALEVDLPELAERIHFETPDAWRVELDALGGLAVEGQSVPLEEIETRFRALIAGAPERETAIVAADKRVPHGRVLEVMERLGKAGVHQLLFEHEAGNTP